MTEVLKRYSSAELPKSGFDLEDIVTVHQNKKIRDFYREGVAAKAGLRNYAKFSWFIDMLTRHIVMKWLLLKGNNDRIYCQINVIMFSSAYETFFAPAAINDIILNCLRSLRFWRRCFRSLYSLAAFGIIFTVRQDRDQVFVGFLCDRFEGEAPGPGFIYISCCFELKGFQINRRMRSQRSWG